MEIKIEDLSDESNHLKIYINSKLFKLNKDDTNLLELKLKNNQLLELLEKKRSNFNLQKQTYFLPLIYNLTESDENIEREKKITTYKNYYLKLKSYLLNKDQRNLKSDKYNKKVTFDDINQYKSILLSDRFDFWVYDLLKYLLKINLPLDLDYNEIDNNLFKTMVIYFI